MTINAKFPCDLQIREPTANWWWVRVERGCPPPAPLRGRFTADLARNTFLLRSTLKPNCASTARSSLLELRRHDFAEFDGAFGGTVDRIDQRAAQTAGLQRV